MGDSTAAMSQRRWSLMVLASVLVVGVAFLTISPLFGLRWYLPVYDRFASMLPIVFVAPIPVGVGYAYVLTRGGGGSVAPARIARGVAAMLVTAPLLLLLDTPATTTLSYALYGLGVGVLGILSVVVLYNSNSAA